MPGNIGSIDLLCLFNGQRNVFIICFSDPFTEMKVSEIRLIQTPDKSFIVYKENNHFSKWHHHPEYELVLITKGKGRRMVGDHIDRFWENDLVLMGPYTPHEWLCDPQYFGPDDTFYGEGIVIQFLPDFLGDRFFDIPENIDLKKFLKKSARGIEILGKTRERINEKMLSMEKMSSMDQLYALFDIFKQFIYIEDYNILASPAFMEEFASNEKTPMHKVHQYIMQNFQHQIHLDELLDISNMSYSSFCASFKTTFRMTFKEYLLDLRVGYACKLLTESTQIISEIAFICGFENISNFNRQFKKIKGITPSQYQKQIYENRSALYR